MLSAIPRYMENTEESSLSISSEKSRKRAFDISMPDSCDQEHKKLAGDKNRSKKLRGQFSADTLALTAEKRAQMDQQEIVWAIFSFNGLAKYGALGGVYEILELGEIIYISGIPRKMQVRDALNAHFGNTDGLPLGIYLGRECCDRWRDFEVRFMPSKNPREDARLLINDFQLKNNGETPKFNN